MLFFTGGAAFTMQDDFITVTLRSHITPSVYVDGFVPGKKFPVKLPGNTTVKA